MTWNQVIMYFIETVFKIIIVVLIPYAFSMIRMKLNNDIEIKYLDKAEQFIRDAVDQVQQTYVANMKAENLFDEEAQIKAFEMVKKNVLSMMNNRMMEIVMEAVGDFDEFMRNIIESQVYANKQNSSVLLGEVISDETGEKADAE